MLWYVPGQGIVDDSQEGVSIPEPGEMVLPGGEKITWGVQGTQKLPEYRNTWQYGQDPFQWDPQHLGAGQGPSGSYNVGYIPSLIDAAEALRLGAPMPDYEREQVEQMLQAARATPMRDLSQLQAGSPGEGEDLSRYLTPASPDAGAVMLALRDKIQGGQASPQERGLYDTFLAQMREQEHRANVPQASDAFNPLGDNLFGALGTLALGATGGLAAAPLFAGGAGLATTLGSLGTLSGLAGTGAGVLGGATGQAWLSKAGLGLGALGSVLGGVGGLSSLWGSGVQSLSDAAKLASSAGKITGALGRASGNDALRQASRYLGQAGQLGAFGAGVLPTSVTDWSGDSAPWAQSVAPGVSNLLSAADMATERGGGGMEWDYSNDWGASAPYDDWSWNAGATGPSAWDTFTGWGDPTGPGSSGDAGFRGEGSGGWLSSVLGGLGSVGSWLGPAASALGGLGAGAIGSRASGDAAAAQAAALGRGLDLQTAQWLQQQANQAPWLQAGQQALPHLQQLAARGSQTPFQPAPALRGVTYGLPSTTPGWTPQTYQGPAPVSAGDYRWTPGQGPRAADYRYTPGQIPDADQFRYTPGAVPTLSGRDLLANDPGVQFRLDEGRKALEASALARGTGMSGATLAALQRQGQELSSQEYGNAWNRASQQAQLREQWAQQASQMGFGQQMSEAELRERVNQVASQQGWSQAQAEAAFREQMAQLASQQGWQQALQGQQSAFGQGLEAQKWNVAQQQAYDESLYGRNWQNANQWYQRDLLENQTNYERALAAYNSQNQQQTTDWNRWASLAGLGQTAANQLGETGYATQRNLSSLLSQLGTAQSQGALNQGNAWQNALTNVGGAANSYFGNQAYLQGLQGILGGLNR